MEQGLSLGQLVILFPSYTISGMVIQGLSASDRMQNIREALIMDELVERSNINHPNYVKLFSLWEEYLTSEREDLKMYDVLKQKFIESFGQTMFYDYLNMTYYFCRSEWMLKNNLYDTNERILVD